MYSRERTTAIALACIAMLVFPGARATHKLTTQRSAQRSNRSLGAGQVVTQLLEVASEMAATAQVEVVVTAKVTPRLD